METGIGPAAPGTARGGDALAAPSGSPRPAGSPTPSPVLVVGFDRRPASLAALAAAADLGDRLGAEIRVVHAVDLADFPGDPDCGDWETLASSALGAERAAVADVLERYRHGWTYRSVRADPVAALVEAAERRGALMIVVGARGDGLGQLVERLVPPSVGHRLVHRAGRPILVVGPHRHPHG